MNVFEKEKKDRVPFLRQKPRPKKGKTAFSCEAAADLTSSEKGSFFKQDEWLQEIEGDERKEASQMIRRLITPKINCWIGLGSSFFSTR